MPAHRVVNRLGLLTGAVHFPAEAPMAEQLQEEGVEVVDDQVVGFDGVFGTRGRPANGEKCELWHRNDMQ